MLFEFSIFVMSLHLFRAKETKGKTKQTIVEDTRTQMFKKLNDMKFHVLAKTMGFLFHSPINV